MLINRFFIFFAEGVSW